MGFTWVHRCGNLTTTESSEADPTSEHDEENVRKHLNLPLSTGGDVTAECIASNEVGAFRKVFHLRMFSKNMTTVYFQPSVQVDITNMSCVFQESTILGSCQLWLELAALPPSFSCSYWWSSTSGDRFESNTIPYTRISWPNQKLQRFTKTIAAIGWLQLIMTPPAGQ